MPVRAMQLAGRIWLSQPCSGRTLGLLPFPGAAKELGLRAKLERKPWVILSKAREELEDHFGLATDELLLALAEWLASAVAQPGAAPRRCAVGLAHVSGNIYLAPALGAEPALLAPEQVLVANLFSHGEIGLDAIAARGNGPAEGEAAKMLQPSEGSGDLLREVATFKGMRWVLPDGASSGAGGAASRKRRKSNETSSIAKPVRRSVFKRHPLVSEVLAAAGDAGSGHKGDCLQHSNFVHLDLEGRGIEELQASFASNSAKRAYSPAGAGSTGLAGCALRTRAGALFAGSAICTQSGLGSVTPLETALVSMCANGADVADIVCAMWAASASERSSGAVAETHCKDKQLLSSLVPSAIFESTSLVE